MYQTIYRYLLGYLTIEVEGESPERFLNMCMHHKIDVWNLVVIDNKYRFCILKKELRGLRPMTRKTNVKLRIINKQGLPFFLYRNRKRKIFVSGFFTCFITLFLLSQFIWNINISGNQYYTDERIVEFLNENNIQIAMLARDINSDEITSMLRSEFSSIVWTSAYIDGCQLIIKIKENDTMVEIENEMQVISDYQIEYGTDIVAEVSGVVTYMVTRSGQPLVNVGDVVEEGDVLVSGRLEIYADYDVLMGYKYVESEADIGINTSYEYYDILDLDYSKKIYLEDQFRSFFLIFNSYYIEIELHNPLTFLTEYLNNVLEGGVIISEVEMEAVSSEYEDEVEEIYLDYITKSCSIDPQQQSFICLEYGLIQNQYYVWEDSVYTTDEVEEILNYNFQLYCSELIEKKVEIIENNVKISIKEINAVAEGELSVVVTNDKFEITEVLEQPEIVQEEGISE